MKLNELPDRKTILAIGESGSGKTHLVGTLCRLIDTVVVTGDAEGLETLRAMKVQPYEIFWIQDWEEIWKLAREIKELSSKVRAIALDDYGSIQNAKKIHIQKSRHSREEEKMKPDEFEAFVGEEMLSGRRRLGNYRQFGEMLTALDTLNNEVRNSQFKVILATVLEDIKPHPRTGRDHVFPGLEGSIKYELLARYRLVGHLYRVTEEGTTTFNFSTLPHENIPTKDCYTAMPRNWRNPDMAEILRHLSIPKE